MEKPPVDLPIACHLDAMTVEQRARREELVLDLRASLDEVVDLPVFTSYNPIY